MSYPHASTKKKKSKSKQSQSRSRSKSPRPSSKSQRPKHIAPSLNSSSSHSPRPKTTKKTHKISTPPDSNRSKTNKSFRMHTPTPRTPKAPKTPKTPKTPKMPKTPKTPKTPRNKSSNKSPRPKSSKSPYKSPKHKTSKPRTTSSPLKSPLKTPKNKKNKNKSKTNSKQRTISTPKPKTHIKKPILQQSHSSSVDHSMDQSLIDERHNLSPNKKKGKNKKINAKKRSFYGDSYSTKNKGKLQERYKIKEKIGSGTFSTVRRGIRRSDKQEIAIKIITKTDLNDTEARLIKREIGVMETLSNHANIVKLYDIFETTHHLYLVIEYCKGGELFDELINCTPKGWFSERETSQIIRQIALGIKYMHSKNIVHRDLKLENVLISTKQSYQINRKKKKFSVDTTEHTDNNNLNPIQCNKKSKTERGKLQIYNDYAQDDSDENEDLDSVINRRHSDCISQIPQSILYGHNTSDHKGPETSIMIKISDFGLSKKIEPPKNNNINDDEKKQQEKKKKKHKIPHILSKKYKKKKKDEFNDREFAVMATNCGTLYYVAPEILNNEPYNEKVDCWSLGVICYVLLCGSLPFYSENELEISDLILKCKYDLGETDDHWLKVSESAKDLISNLLTLDKKNRFNITQVLKHPFIIGENKLMSNKRRSVKWNAGGLFAGIGNKYSMKFKNILDSAKNISFHHESDNDTDDYIHSQPPPSPNNGKKVKYKIPFGSEHE